MQSVSFRFALCLVVVSTCTFGARSSVTPGWENTDPSRLDPPVENALWRADFGRKDAFTLECREGAEGAVEFSGGKMTVRKTNDRGYLLVRAPSFAVATDAAISFSADVRACDVEPEYCHAVLRAFGENEYLGVRPEDRRVDNDGGWQLMCGLVNTPEGVFIRKYFHHRPDGKRIVPVIAVYGRKSVSVWKEWAATDAVALKEAWGGVRAVGDARRKKAVLMDEAEFERRNREDIAHTARTVVRDGRCILEIDGRIAPPVAFHTVYRHSDHTEITAGLPLLENGVKIAIPMVEGGTGNTACWTSKGYDAEKAVDILRESMRITGDSLYVVAYSCNAYRDFVSKDHPGEGWILKDGTPLRGAAGSCCVGYQGMSLDKAWPWVSMASRVWRDAVKSNIRAFVAELRRQGLDKRVIGVHLYGYNDGQFGMNYPDFSVHAKAEYEKYLAAGTGGSTNYHHFCRQLGVMAQNEFAAAFKKAMGKDVIAIRWYDSPFVVDFGLDLTMRTDGIDIVVPQPTYRERAPGIAAATFAPFSSLHLHGKMLWNELDLRTWWMPSSTSVTGYRCVCPADNFSAWQTIHRKYAGEMLAGRSGYWFYDMNRGWFASPEIGADVGETLATVRRLNGKAPSPWRPETALVIDEEGFLGWDGGERPFPAHTYNISERQIRILANSGVPYEYYSASDVIDRPELLDNMKTVVFMLWRKFDAKRLAAAKRLAKKGRTLVFLSECGSLGGAREATGFGIDFDFGSKCMGVEPVPGADVDTVGSYDVELMRSCFGRDPKRPIKPPYGRRGTIAEEPGVKVLGRFSDDGKAAIAERTDGGCRKVYVSAPGGLSPSYFNNLVRGSGAYVPVDRTGLQINMNGDFVSVHALRGGRYDFRLPFPCRVTNVKTGREEKLSGGVLPLVMTPGQTCWFLLERE